MNAREFEPYVALVTGGSRGIGRAVALRAAAAGWNVAFTYRSDQCAAFRTVSEIESRGRLAAAIRADVGNQREVRDAFAAVIDRFGRLDAVVNNAGVIGGQRAVADIDEQLLLDVFRPNVFGTFYCAAEAVRRMSLLRGGRGGVIINVSSAAARHGGMPNESHYAASKGALDSLTIALAKELAPHGIRVNAVRPGLIVTSIHDSHGGEETIRRIAPTIPLGRAGTVEEVASTVVFLMSAESSYVHGAVLDVSGGR
jgi:NAD(P)-dependent dehydrogenase (short-subunit alcohol dehydrogenase family)